MTTILLDPTLRRARIMRATVAVFILVAVGAAALCAVELRARERPGPALPSPRRGSKSSGRRPYFGQRAPVKPERRLRRDAPDARAARPHAPGVGDNRAPRVTNDGAPRVTAFVDPSVRAALSSLQAHATQLAAVAFTGLLVDDAGGVIDHLDRGALRNAANAHVTALALVQNLDEKDGRWRPDRVRALGRDPHARQRFGAQLAATCRASGLSGVHLDLEALDEDWGPVPVIAADAARALHAGGFELSVDVPASLDAAVLASVSLAADHVVVMAYDEHDADGPAGPIASDDFVANTLDAAAAIVPAAKLTAGLAIYGYDWIGDESADPISFVDAHSAAREAHADVRWDRGNVRFQLVDDDGTHQIWLTDAASVWNGARAAAAAGAHDIALWRLGGEDPGIWAALAHLADPAPPIASVAADVRVTNEGDGPFLSLALSPSAGQRVVKMDQGLIVDERWTASPSPYLVRRGGIVPGAVALTFDDGPDPEFTPQILDILEREHVPATFFVIGARAATSGALIARMNASGHEIGNHTFSHPNIDDVGALRLRTELESTTQIVASIVGRRPLLYRPPSLADVEPRTVSSAAAFARAGSLGYLVVDADVDPRDWEQQRSAAIVADTLAQAEHGGVILLHDGGGNRAATVEALPAIISGLRQRGLRFVALSELIGKKRDDVMPGVTEAPVAGHLVRALLASYVVLRALLVATLLLVALRALFVIAAACVSERRRMNFRPRGPLPPVTALIPAFNESAVIARTIDAVLASDVPVDVVVIDDGSSDDTAAIVTRRYRREPRVRLIRQKNGGKAAALRSGVAACRTEVVVALDADTLFAPTTVRRLIEPFCNPRVGAVAGTAEVGNVENRWARWQALEYLTQQELERRAWDSVAAVPIVPGAVGAWRRRAVIDAGGFSSDTLAEDADLAMALCRRGWRVAHAAAARARTEVPATRGELVKQRARWSFGVLQALWKHRRALVERRAGAFGRIVWPAMVMFVIALPLAAPAALISLAVALAAHNLAPALVATGVLATIEVAQFVVASSLAARSGGTYGWRLAPTLLTARLCYRVILWFIALRSIARLVDGIPLGWGTLNRRNTAVAYAVATAPARAIAD